MGIVWIFLLLCEGFNSIKCEEILYKICWKQEKEESPKTEVQVWVREETVLLP